MNAGTPSTQSVTSSTDKLQPTAIMHNLHAMFPSFAMLAGMQLDLFTPLKDGPMSGDMLASTLGVRADTLLPVLYALVVAGLLHEENGYFSNTEEADTFLVRGRQEYIGGLSGLYSIFLGATLKTAESVRQGKPQAKHDFSAFSDEELLAYFQKQVHSSRNGGKEIAKHFDFSPYNKLLDAGGGSGGVAMALCAAYPHLKATVADLPKIARLAAHFIEEAGMSGKINVSPTDLCADKPEGNYDVAILRALIQTLSKQDAQKVLQHVGQSMVPGGRLFIFGNVLENSRLGPPASIALSLVFLNVYDDGKAYTEDEYREMLSAAGFVDIAIEHDVLPDGMGVVSARKRERE